MAVIGGPNSSSDRVHKFSRLLMEEGALLRDKNTHLLVSADAIMALFFFYLLSFCHVSSFLQTTAETQTSAFAPAPADLSDSSSLLSACRLASVAAAAAKGFRSRTSPALGDEEARR